jgi:rhamnosyltransferase
MGDQDVMGMIVTYKPEIELLTNNISAIINQVGRLVIFDNKSDNIEDIRRLCKKYGAQLIENSTNEGVAGPLHNGVLLAKELGYKYILTLDHDSVAAPDMVEELKKTLESNGAAMVGSTFVDTRPEVSDVQRYKTPDRDTAVLDVNTSGTLADVDTIIEVGNYAKELVIYWVDNEICYRLTENGKKIMQCANAKLNHREGYPERKRFFFRYIHTFNYSPFSLYYQIRNMKYLLLKYKSNREQIGRYKKFIDSINSHRKVIKKSILKIILFEKNKFQKLKAIRKGFKDAKGFHNKYGKKTSGGGTLS